MKKLLLLGLAIFTPIMFANSAGGSLANVDSLINKISDWIELLIPIVVSLAILAFLWGIFVYVIAKDEDAKGRGKNIMIWGVVGIFVMVSVWGLVSFIQTTLDIDSDSAPTELQNLVLR